MYLGGYVVSQGGDLTSLSIILPRKRCGAQAVNIVALGGEPGADAFENSGVERSLTGKDPEKFAVGVEAASNPVETRQPATRNVIARNWRGRGSVSSRNGPLSEEDG